MIRINLNNGPGFPLRFYLIAFRAAQSKFLHLPVATYLCLGKVFPAEEYVESEENKGDNNNNQYYDKIFQHQKGIISDSKFTEYSCFFLNLI